MSDPYPNALNWRARGTSTPFILGRADGLVRLEEARSFLMALSHEVGLTARRSWLDRLRGLGGRRRVKVDAIELVYALTDVSRMVGDSCAGIREEMRGQHSLASDLEGYLAKTIEVNEHGSSEAEEEIVAFARGLLERVRGGEL